MFGDIGEAVVDDDDMVCDAEEVLNTFLCGFDFSNTRTSCSFVLSDCFSINRTTGTANHIAREGSKFEEFKGRAIFDCISKLATPVGITEGSELQVMGVSICVSYFIGVMWDMIECLQCLMCGRVEGDALFASTVEVCQPMEG